MTCEHFVYTKFCVHSITKLKNKPEWNSRTTIVRYLCDWTTYCLFAFGINEHGHIGHPPPIISSSSSSSSFRVHSVIFYFSISQFVYMSIVRVHVCKCKCARAFTLFSAFQHYLGKINLSYTGTHTRIRCIYVQGTVPFNSHSHS